MKRPRWLHRRRHLVAKCPECGAACTPETYCEYCGYDLVEKSRGEVSRFKPPS